MNLDTAGMKNSSSSFTDFSTSCISFNLSSIGVSLGSNSYEVSVSGNVLRHLEYDRFTVTPKVSTVLEQSSLEDDEEDTSLEGKLPSALVGVISEVDLKESELSSLYELKASRRNSKSSAEKKHRNFNKATKSKIVSK
jgi:hypothetical protein